MSVDLKTLTPDTTLPQDGLLFGADSQASTNPSVYPVANVKDALNSGIGTLASTPTTLWDVAVNPVASLTLTQNTTLYVSNFKAGGTYRLIVFQDATGSRTLSYDGNIQWPNGSAPTITATAYAMTELTFVSDGVYMYGSVVQPYNSGPYPTVSGIFATPAFDYSTLSTVSSMPSGGSITRAGNAMLYDSTGALTWAPNNLLLQNNTFATSPWYLAAGTALASNTNNSAQAPDLTATAGTLVTGAGSASWAQNISAVDGIYIISVWARVPSGTASIQFGFGGNSSTFTVTTTWQRFSYRQAGVTSGTVQAVIILGSSSTTYQLWGAQVELVTYQTTPSGTYYLNYPTPNTTAAYYGPRFDYDPATLAAKGLLVEGARTNLLNFSQSFATSGGTQNNWADTNITRNSTNNTSPDGTGNALRVTASAGNGTIISSAAIGTSAQRVLSVWLRRVTGTGNIQYTLDNGSNWTTQAITSSWVRYAFPATTANQQVGFRIVTSGDAIEIWGVQLEAGAFASSYTSTTADAVARAAETFTLANYQNRLVESFYIDEETGGSWSANINASATSPLTISTPTFGWVTSLRPYTNAYAGDITTPSWIDNSGTTGNRMYYDSTGALTWAPSNMLLNSATLSTQTVTVTSGVTNILSFSGTGSITYSGAASGTLTGTGVSTRVSVALTMTTASLTLTVSGSVTSAQLERVTYQTSPRAYIPTTSAAVYQPRYDYDPSVTPATPRGMLIEESRANTLQRSQEFDNAYWGKSDITVSANVTTAPDGTTSADALIESATTANHYMYSPTVSVTSGNAYTYSIYLKANGRTSAVFYFTAGFTNIPNAKFNLLTGVVSYANDCTANIQSVGNGWYRCSMTATATSTTTTLIYTFLNIDASYAGNGVSGLYAWQAQFEVGAFVTSPIPTTSTSVTRVADVVKLTGSAFTVTANNPATAAVEYLLPNNQSSRRILWANELSSGNYTNNVRITNDNVGLVAAGVDKTKSIAYTSGQINRLIMGWGGAGWSAYQNAGTLQTDTSAMPTGISDTRLGSHNDGVYMNGYVRSLALYSQRLPDAILAQKSTVGSPY